MAQVTAGAVKDLREKTGAGMMDCKKALAESEGNMEAAMDWLRRKGLSQARKKAGRAAAEGLVGVATRGNRGAVVELNAETDFVARNPQFQEVVGKLAELALDGHGDLESLKAAPYPGTGRNVEEELTQLVATIGENMNLRRMAVLSVERGAVAAYVHNPQAAGMGKIGVLVALESEGDAGRLAETGRHLAMHVAAARPSASSADKLDPAEIEREREFQKDKARESGKPEEIVEKMVEGRMRKFYEEVVLTEQVYVVDNETKVAKILEQLGAEIGSPVRLVGFERFELGEGVEKKQEDFAEEVAATLTG